MAEVTRFRAWALGFRLQGFPSLFEAATGSGVPTEYRSWAEPGTAARAGTRCTPGMKLDLGS